VAVWVCDMVEGVGAISGVWVSTEREKQNMMTERTDIKIDLENRYK